MPNGTPITVTRPLGVAAHEPDGIAANKSMALMTLRIDVVAGER
jgi:hypothetical protein